ncbi:fungal specific transcription factor [Hirsutella rhossiliensis]
MWFSCLKSVVFGLLNPNLPPSNPIGPPSRRKTLASLFMVEPGTMTAADEGKEQPKSPEKPSTDDDPDRRACDQCRQRKTRCDRNWPCSTCRTASRQCTTTGAGQRLKEPRQRILISSRYERKIDEIVSRLGSIESLLSSRPVPPVSVGHRTQHAHSDAKAFAIPTPASASGFESTRDESPFAPDSGLSQQSNFARVFLEEAAKRSTLPGFSPEITTALNNLRQLVELQELPFTSYGLQVHFPLKKTTPPGGLCKLPMPPIAACIHLLEIVKDSPPSLFSFTCSIVGITDFSNLCRSFYFPTSDNPSDANFIIVNAMLYNLFTEQFSLATDPAIQSEYDSYIQICRVNIETGLAATPLVLSAAVENVQALLLGTLYAIDISRAFVAWHLVSTAARLCQAGRFHHADNLKYNSPQVSRLKRILFWHVYMLERGLCLGLGRTSVILESDIDIPREFDLDGFGNLESSGLGTLWIKTGSLQGRIYEKLYSRAAVVKPQLEVIQEAHVLAAECRELEKESAEYRNQLSNYHRAVNSSKIMSAFLRGDDIQFLSTLTLVYRLIPTPEGSVSRFSNECLETARRAVRAHLDCIRGTDTWNYIKSIYIHWYLTVTPFTPFFVLICYVIETSSLEDLKLLQDFISSFKSSRRDSETIEKFYRLCQVMCDAVGIYVEAKLQQQDQLTRPIGDEFEMYWSQLGFMTEEQSAIDRAFTEAPGQRNAQVTPMTDWFLGSRNIVGLLEEDMSQIDFSQWM